MYLGPLTARRSRFPYLAALLPCLLVLAGAADPPPPERPQISDSDEGVRTSSRTGSFKAPTDTFYLYGGPGSDEGKFGSIGAPSRDGWTGFDETDIPTFWHRSEFNASTLNANGPGNVAAWCGQSGAQQPGWATAPGYGNRWDQSLKFEVPVTDPLVGQVVQLDFYFHHDTEPGYDYFKVQYDSAGTWVTALTLDGTDAVAGAFQAPGQRYSALPGAQSIVYAGGDYGLDGVVRLRLNVSSDGAWSDEDGIFDSLAGAVQVDDVTVTCSEGNFFEDFEAGFTHWRPDKTAFAGDFFDVYPRFTDIDPCASNNTPVAGFIDYGQVVNNSASAAAIPGYPISTGGEQPRPNPWGADYGIPGGWVVNYHGGLSDGEVSLANWMLSPEIAWDLPGAGDDGIEYAGAKIRFDVYQHMVLLNGLGWQWNVRSGWEDGQGVKVWGAWRHRGFSYFDLSHGRWSAKSLDVADLIDPAREFVQLRLGVVDVANLFGYPGNDATPSPVFDNVAFLKYQVGGAVITVRDRDLSNDGFPASGSIDASTLAARDALDVRFDMARDVSTGSLILPGDSLLVKVTTAIPGTSLQDLRMVWVLDKNPVFEDAIRSAPVRAVDENVDTTDATRWKGEVVATASIPDGAILLDHYYFDLPDVDFLYPGDRLRYYFRAIDSDGRVSTMPDDTSGFLSGAGYDRSFQVYALPTIQDASGTQPRLLIINDGRRGDLEDVFLNAFGQLGYVEGDAIDTYTVQAAGSGIGNGIGSSVGHGATGQQLAGYDRIFYLTSDRSSYLLSDGTNWGRNDKSDDLGILNAWRSLPGSRNVVYFGDAIAAGLEDHGAAGAVYVHVIMRIGVSDSNVNDNIDGQTSPIVRAVHPSFAQSFVAYGGCPGINQFDNIAPLAPAFRAHGFEVAGSPGTTYDGIAASVVHDRLVEGDRKVDITFPFGLEFVYSRNDAGAPFARTKLIQECLDYFGVAGLPGPTVDVPTLGRATLELFPNPFNPRTVVSLALPASGDARVEIYDLRGRHVRTLHQGKLESGIARWTWEATDDAGASVASGVYVVRASGDGFELQRNAVLLK